jgi:aminomethyltransferase
MDETLLMTPLAAEHRELEARMVPFAGWLMPVQYSEGILAEHQHCRQQAALFDICHMGEFRVRGAQAAADLDRILARPVADQPVGSCRYNFSLNEQGGVRDDLIVYRLAEEEFYLVVNAGPCASDAAWIAGHLSATSQFCDESATTAKLDLQGPESAAVLSRLGLPMASLPRYFRFCQTHIASVPVLLSRTGYTGELGFELFFAAEDAVKLWRLLLADPAVKPVGLGARDTLRLELGFCLYGHELDEATTPAEAGFGAMLKLEQARDFIGSAALCDPVAGKPRRRLIGMQLDSKRAARAGAAIYCDEEEVGVVSSGAVAPSLECAIAMGYVRADLELPVGSSLALDTGRVRLPARVVELPFYKGGSARRKLDDA